MSTPVVVKKFGGTSVGSIERIESVADRVCAALQAGERPVVVVSAMSGETNRLVNLAGQVYPHYRGRAYDMLVASGEQVSVALLSMVLEKRGKRAQPLLAYQLGIYTDSLYSKARIQKIDPKAILTWVDQGVVPVVAGFQGIDEEDQLTTLGRGGSDTTAVALAVAIQQDLGSCGCEIFTDVPAVFSADPRLVKEAREIPKLSFEEMMEMAALGSKVLHIRCVELAAKYNLPIHLRSSLEPREGTWICQEEEGMEQAVVSAVTHDAATTVFKLFPVPYGSGFLADLFTQLSDRGVVVDIITQSQNEEGQRLAISISDEDLPRAEEVFAKAIPEGVRIDKMSQMAKVSVVGVGMRNHPGVAARFFAALKTEEVSIHIVTTSEIKISAVIDGEALEKTVKALHQEFAVEK